MTDARAARLAGMQFNRVSIRQLQALGMSEDAVAHRVAKGRFVIVEQGVYAMAPVRADDDWGRWMAATLTAPGSVLSHASAAAAAGTWSLPRDVESVTRPGSGGPRRFGGVVVFRSTTLEGDTTVLRGIPITNPSRTVLDLAPHVSERAIARLVRETVRLRRASVHELADAMGRHRGRRGCGRVGEAIARYSGLPIERARSGAEVRALEILRDAGRPMPRLNVRVAGVEADLSWPRERRIIEIDGEPFHLDRGEDLRRRGIWEAAGWSVVRISSEIVYGRPELLLRAALG
jgi:hypothetical protein